MSSTSLSNFEIPFDIPIKPFQINLGKVKVLAVAVYKLAFQNNRFFLSFYRFLEIHSTEFEKHCS